MPFTNFDQVQVDNGNADVPQLISAAGAISQRSGLVIITAGSAIALTLAAPTAGAVNVGGDDGKVLTIQSNTAFAHTITNSTPGFNAGGAVSDVATFSAAIGNNLVLRAYNGRWLVQSSVGATLA
ncbi:MAG: hypothetical protein EBR82_34530 [Caulobacteraceae bacterium]|nr:hypothetical protein [Caulobacteraceae bacterium]